MKLNSKPRTPPQKSLKYFVGIDVPAHIKEEINEFVKENSDVFSSHVDFFSKHEYHITLAYLGLITEEQRERLIAVSDKIIVPPFSISIQGLGFHPAGKNPKALWLGVGTGREKMNVFAENIRNQIMMKAGLMPKDKFVPHITIGKINPGTLGSRKNLFKFVNENWDYPFGSFKIESFHLYRITNSGYQYNHEIKLKNPARLVW